MPLPQVALHNVQSSIPGVRRVPLVPTGDNAACMDLQDALPLASFLAPVQECKAAISAAIEGLQSRTEGTAATVQQRGLGPALQVFIPSSAQISSPPVWRQALIAASESLHTWSGDQSVRRTGY